MSLDTLLHRASLPNPEVSVEQALALLKEHYGKTGVLHSLGSQQDLNYRVSGGEKRFVLKICHGTYAMIELEAQHAALVHLKRKGVPVPTVYGTLKGQEITRVALGADKLILIRLLDYIEGQPLTTLKHMSSKLLASMGKLCAQVDVALADFDHKGLERILQWDPRNAKAIIAHLLPVLTKPELAARVSSAAAEAQARLAPLIEHLPVQAIHLDITDDNSVWTRDAQLHWQVQGVIDFGDLVRTWRIADLSITCAALLHHVEGDAFRILPAIHAYHAVNPLKREELQALWPLIVARAAILVLSGEQQCLIDPSNDYSRNNLVHEWEIFDVATSVPFELMEAAILSCAGMQYRPLLSENEFSPLLPSLDAKAVTTVDLGVLSPFFQFGNWETEGADQALLASQAAKHAGFSSSLYGQYRLSRTRPDCPVEPDTCALHVELHLPSETAVHAPFAGVLKYSGSTCILSGKQVTLHLHGVTFVKNASAGTQVAQKQVIGHSSGNVRVILCGAASIAPPLFTTPSRAAAWLALCPSPQVVLKFKCDAVMADSHGLLTRRGKSFARTQKFYYEEPPQIERGWRNQLIDVQGRSYVDMLNNVAVLGHGHPRMAAVSARQWSLMNTNSRFHYSAITEFSERLLKLCPPSFDRVFMVNSGTEANDLAIRLAWAFTGAKDMLSVLEAYHGWSVACDAISTSIADNPIALTTRPDWVHPVVAPNTYRGAFRGPHSTPDYLKSVDAHLNRLVSQKRNVAGFICEPVYGNAGGIALPPGYLQQVYAKVRALGGVCIADEIQVGYGRLGDYFWGFEEQGVVPDIITMAKGMGNGQPLGVVITRREIAEALEAEGYFFSSAGGSPVSCAIGMAVLDVMKEEGLLEKTREIGGYFKKRLESLIGKHSLVGAVHGSGFYLGVELIRNHETLEPATEETTILCDRLRDLGIFMQPTGDFLNILKIKPPMVTTRHSVDFFVDCVDKVLSEITPKPSSIPPASSAQAKL